MVILKEALFRSVKPSEAKDRDKDNNPKLIFAFKRNEVSLVHAAVGGKVTAIAGGEGGAAGLSFRNTQAFHNIRGLDSVWLDSHLWLDSDIPFGDFRPGSYLIGSAYVPRFDWLVNCLEDGDDFCEMNTAAVDRVDLYKCYMVAAGTQLPNGYLVIEDDTPAGHRTLTFQEEKELIVSKVNKRTVYVAKDLAESVSTSSHCVLVRASARPAARTTAPMAVSKPIHHTSTHTPSNTDIDTTSNTTSNTTTCATPSTTYIPAVLALAGVLWDILPECDVDVDEALFSWISSATISNYSLESAKPLFTGQLEGIIYEASLYISFDGMDLLDHVKQMLAKAEEGEMEEQMLSKPEQERDPPEEVSNQTFEKAKEVSVKLNYERIAAAHLKENDIPAAIKAYGHAQMEAHELDLKKQEKLQYIDLNLGLEAKERGNARFREGGFPGAIKEYEEAVRGDPNTLLEPGQNADYTDVETVGTLSAGSSLPGSDSKITRAQSTDSDTGRTLPAVNLFGSVATAPTAAPSAPSARSPNYRKSRSSFKSNTSTTSPDTPGKEQRK